MTIQMLTTMLIATTTLALAPAQAAPPPELQRLAADTLKLVASEKTPDAKLFPALMKLQVSMALFGPVAAVEGTAWMTGELKKAAARAGQMNQARANVQAADAIWEALAQIAAPQRGGVAAAHSPARARLDAVAEKARSPGLHLHRVQLAALLLDQRGLAENDARRVEERANESLMTASRLLLMEGRSASRSARNALKEMLGGGREAGLAMLSGTLDGLGTIIGKREANTKRIAKVDALARAAGLRWSARRSRYVAPRARRGAR